MSNVTRREFLRTVVISAGPASVGPSLLLGCDGGRPVEEVFPQSVASGDPRPDSIVLWTRAVPADEAADAVVRLEVATDRDFGARVDLGTAPLTARADHDHCVRVKITNLAPDTTYFYRFVHEGSTSHHGRFRTAPDAGADAEVRFAMLSCQDYVGRYYNSLLRLLDDDHDDVAFVVHLGDYVYETTGDPGFMTPGEGRAVTLRAPEEAIARARGEDTFYAARSVSNYRDLYRIYRSDPILQRVHERFAFVCIWDDHEFSDDSWQEHATYTSGAAVEADRERRVNAEQAYFEYMPIARDGENTGELTVDRASLFPSTRLYRGLRFGQHLSLALTDYRSFRPDHPTPEDAYPGAVVLTENQVRAALDRLERDGELPAGTTAAAAFAAGNFRRYVDLDAPGLENHRLALEIVLTAAYASAGVEAARAAQLASQYAGGPSDAGVLLRTIEAGRAALPPGLVLPPLDPDDEALPRGLPYAMTGKSGLVGQLGARYLVVKATYDLVQVLRSRVEGDAAHDDVLGAAQQTWLANAVSESDATWRVIANSVCNTSLILNLEAFASVLPPELPAARYLLNVDHWDGFPERRRALMQSVYRPSNAILLAGDVHAAYATDFGADAEGNRVIELTTPAVSSGTFRDLLYNTGNAVPSIRDSGLLGPVLDGIDGFLQGGFAPFLRFAQSHKHGVIVVTAGATALRADFHLLPADAVSESYYDRAAELAGRWERVAFSVAKVDGKNGPLTRVS